MNDLTLQIAGGLAIFAALGHSYFGDQTLRAQPFEPPHIKKFIRCCYQFGSLGWLAGGILLLLAPSVMTSDARFWLICVLVPVYGFGGVVNAWFTRGRHFGWVILAAVVLLALFGF